MAFNGLDSAGHMLALNAGRRVSPLFAGDTIYAWSEVIEKIALEKRDDIGALRLRTRAAKNHPCHARYHRRKFRTDLWPNPALSRPKEKRDCPQKKCDGELRYYHEDNNGDLYYCEKCYRIALWDGRSVYKSENEAYPNRDKTKV